MHFKRYLTQFVLLSNDTVLEIQLDELLKADWSSSVRQNLQPKNVKEKVLNRLSISNTLETVNKHMNFTKYILFKHYIYIHTQRFKE